MLKKVFTAIGHAVTFAKKGDPAKNGFSPYSDKSCNAVYNLLFCDKLDLFRKEIGENPQGVWTTLLALEPYAAGLKAIADDQSQESRLRILAYHRLREMQQVVPEKKLLGVVIEVGLGTGLDVLAAYPDGRVRYINHNETLSAFDPAPAAWMPTVRKLMAAAQSAVDQIGPWEQLRIAPPTAGMIRMSFLVSDGLYFGQGAMDVMEQDDMAKPIIATGVELLKLVAADKKVPN